MPSRLQSFHIPGSITLFAILVFVAASRILCAEHYLSGTDPGNYYLGTINYSIEAERPHPPGYPAYILLLRLGAHALGDRHVAMITVQILFSLLAIVAIYTLARRWFGSDVAAISTALLATNPLFWFYGSTSENYVYDAFFASALILSTDLFVDRLLSQISDSTLGHRSWSILVAAAFGLLLGVAGGMRAASLILMAPAAAYLAFARLRQVRKQRSNIIGKSGSRNAPEAGLEGAGYQTMIPIGIALLGLVVGLALWLPWVAASEGGIRMYFRAASGLSPASAGPVAGNMLGMAVTLLWTVNLSGLYAVWRLVRKNRNKPTVLQMPKNWLQIIRTRTLLMWLAFPALFFFMVIYAKGYALLIVPAYCILIALALASEPSRSLKRVAVLTLLGANAAIFLLVPYVSAPAYTMFAPRVRTGSERFQSLLGRATSVYLPALSRIRSEDRQMAEAIALIERSVVNGADTTLLVVDPAAAAATPPRAMQIYLPEVRLATIGIRSDRLVAFFQGINKSQQYGDSASLAAPRILLLTDARLANKYADLSVGTASTTNELALLQIDHNKDGALRKRLEYYFIRWDEGGEVR